MVRENNEDSSFALETSLPTTSEAVSLGIYIVADGMGGHQAGEVASKMAVQIISTTLLDKFREAKGAPSPSLFVKQAIEKANAEIYASASGNPHLSSMGTTVTLGLRLDNRLYLAHAGDSRAYLITDERIEQITRDHSLVQRLIELDQLTPEEAAEHPQRNVLYRAIGQSDTLDVDAITRRLPPRSRLLLCSDGLWNMVSEETIRQVVTEAAYPQDACDKLVRLANDRGGPDNITVVLVQVPG